MAFLLVFCGTTTRSERLAAGGGRALTQAPCVVPKGLWGHTQVFRQGTPSGVSQVVPFQCFPLRLWRTAPQGEPFDVGGSVKLFGGQQFPQRNFANRQCPPLPRRRRRTRPGVVGPPRIAEERLTRAHKTYGGRGQPATWHLEEFRRWRGPPSGEWPRG